MSAADGHFDGGLPPTQYLVLETLAARVRLGEQMWTFPAKLKPALDALRERGLIWWRWAPTPRAIQAYLTEAGKREAFSGEYSPPTTVTRERLVAALQAPPVTGTLAMLEEQGGGPEDLADAILEALDG